MEPPHQTTPGIAADWIILGSENVGVTIFPQEHNNNSSKLGRQASDVAVYRLFFLIILRSGNQTLHIF